MTRIGFGYDSHRLLAGRKLTLGGVVIPHDRGPEAHSDGDVVLHALTDAILGAAAAGGDIGEHFSDSDAKWKNADSRIFVKKAMDLVRTGGWRVGNCDLTILAEAPKLGPHKIAMARNVAELLAVGPDCVSVKAKTNEGMGLIGTGEGIACWANVLLVDQER